MDKRKRFYDKRGICKICGKKKHLSRNGNCVNCATNLVISANYQIKTKQGPIYEKFKRKLLEKI